jgi:hypothetical protein
MDYSLARAVTDSSIVGQAIVPAAAFQAALWHTEPALRSAKFEFPSSLLFFLFPDLAISKAVRRVTSLCGSYLPVGGDSETTQSRLQAM